MKSNIELADTFLSNQNYIMAKELYDRAYHEDTDSAGLFGMALCAFHEGNPVECLDKLNQLLERDPDHAAAFNLSGMVATNSGDLDGAEKLFITAIQKNPEMIEAQRNYGEVLIAKEDYENGVKVLDAILKKHPDDIPTLLTMSELSLEAGMDKEALLYLNQVFDLEPDNLTATELLSRVERKILQP